MTKEELERIKQAYYSGLKVQIWFNGHWENFDARDYSMYSDPFSENRLYRIVGSAYADIAEKRIAELEKENAELKETCNKWFEHLKNREEELLNELNNQNVKYESQIEELEKENAELKEKFTIAKEIIENIIRVTWGEGWNYSLDWKVKAEQFLEEN